VKIGPVEGTVEEINLRSTRIRTGEDSVITLPNSNLIRASVENMGARRFRRLKFSFGVAYDTPSHLLEGFLQAIRDALEKHPTVRKEGFYAELNEFTDVSLRVLVECGLLTSVYAEELRTKSELLIDINEAAKLLGVQLQGAPKPAEAAPLPGVAQPAQLGDESPTLD
jgi:MscS family membrane protein